MSITHLLLFSLGEKNRWKKHVEPFWEFQPTNPSAQPSIRKEKGHSMFSSYVYIAEGQNTQLWNLQLKAGCDLLARTKLERIQRYKKKNPIPWRNGRKTVLFKSPIIVAKVRCLQDRMQPPKMYVSLSLQIKNAGGLVSISVCRTEPTNTPAPQVWCEWIGRQNIWK